MTWLLIILVLVVAFGPVLWLVPSKRDKRLSALRSRARAEGLIVEMRRIPKPDPTPEERVSAGGRVRDPAIECASYGLPLARGLKYLPTFRLVRMSADQGPDPFPDWQYDQRPTGDGRAYLEEVLAETGKLTQALPEDVAAVELGARMVLVYWLEKPGSTEALVPDLASAMGAFGDSLNRLDRQIEEDRSSNDS